MPSERAITQKITAFLRSRGFLVRKIHGGHYQSTGWPDLECWSPTGVNFHLEVKRPGKKPTALQQARMRELRKQNVLVDIVYCVEDVGAFLKTHHLML